MKCPKCGNVVEAGYKFCSNCGTAIPEATEEKTNAFGSEQSKVTPQPASQPKQTQSVPTPNQTTQNQKTAGKTVGQAAAAKKSTKMLVPIIIIAVIAAAIIAALALHKPTINLNKYIESSVELSGYEGAGTVTASLDYDSIVYDYADKIKLNKQSASMLDDDWGFTKDELLEMALDDYVDGSFDKSTDLSNGDKVTYKWNISKSAAKNFEKSFKCKLKYKD